MGDILMWVSRLLPSYPIVNTLYVEASAKTLDGLRVYTKKSDKGTAKFGDGNPWSIYNCMGDLTMQFFQFVLWMVVIAMIELE